jgi:hypothetical protein
VSVQRQNRQNGVKGSDMVNGRMVRIKRQSNLFERFPALYISFASKKNLRQCGWGEDPQDQPSLLAMQSAMGADCHQLFSE